MSRRAGQGFTLVELAVVLAIMGVLLGMILVPLGTQWQMRQVRQEQQDLGHIRDALLGFAATQGRLPCPDTDGDGVADDTLPGPTSCGGALPVGNDLVGFLPFADLGLPPGDAWGRLRLYLVERDFVERAVPGTPAPSDTSLDLQDTSDLTVRRRDALKIPTDLTGAAAIVLSLGSNGSGGQTVDGDPVPAPAVLTDEAENTNADTTVITRIRSDGSGAGCSETVANEPYCEFDDLVIWIPETILFNRLIQSGRLP